MNVCLFPNPRHIERIIHGLQSLVPTAYGHGQMLVKDYLHCEEVVTAAN